VKTLEICRKIAVLALLFASIESYATNATKVISDKDNNYFWWEAEDAVRHTFPESWSFRPNSAQEKNMLSNGAWLQTDKGANATAEWMIELPQAGSYNLWVRKFWYHGPFKWRFNNQPERECSRKCSLVDSVEIRKFVCANWVPLGEVILPQGKNTLHIKLDPQASAAGIDCWLLTRGPFVPNGKHKPGEKYNRSEDGWFSFEPDAEKYVSDSMFDFRCLNQKRAGDDGFLKADGYDITFENNGGKVKFWSVTSGFDFDHNSVDYLARRLAKYGVNMVRIHHPIHDKGSKDPTTVDKKTLDRLHYFVASMAKQGIYTKLSFFFPLWSPITKGFKLPGYYECDNKKPFSLLFYHPRMQEIYKDWAKELLTTVNPYTGKSFADDPAVGIVEIVNEDGLFFWTFMPYVNQPAECVQVIEELFGNWLIKKYGSIDNAVNAWGDKGAKPEHGKIENGRVPLYHAGFFGSFDWAINARNQLRAEDQLTFMVELQRGFYKTMSDYFKNELGVKCLISASNWITVDAKNLGAIEKYTYTVCDVIDRHAYYSNPHKGNNHSWSVAAGHTYKDKSGLLIPDSLTKELQYGRKPHIVSEYNYPSPNRFRGEGVYMAATYGSLAGTDAFFFFSMNSSDWQNINTKFPIYTPVVMGQFPAFSYIFREDIVKRGPVVADIVYSLKDLLAMKGTSIVEAAYLDDLRKKDIAKNKHAQVDIPSVIDPLAYYVGQVRVDFSENTGKSKITDISSYINLSKKTVRSATGELFWDWKRGISTLNTTRAQAVCGFLKHAGEIKLDNIVIKSDNEYCTIVAVAIDGKDIIESKRILVQVMTEDRNYGFKSVPVKDDPNDLKQIKGMQEITEIGQAPILVKNIRGSIQIKTADADKAKVFALDLCGYKKATVGTSSREAVIIDFLPDVLYYMIVK
jgi:hypothetical protein